MAQGLVKLLLLGSLNRYANDWQRGRGKDEKDRRGDDELEKRNASVRASEPPAPPVERGHSLSAGNRWRQQARNEMSRSVHPFRIAQFRTTSAVVAKDSCFLCVTAGFDSPDLAWHQQSAAFLYAMIRFSMPLIGMPSAQEVLYGQQAPHCAPGCGRFCCGAPGPSVCDSCEPVPPYHRAK